MKTPMLLLSTRERIETTAGRYEAAPCLRPSPTVLLLDAPGLVRDGDLLCLFQGSIYRYDDASLPQGSPEEYLLAAWRKYGEDFLLHFEGKFVLSLLDLRDNTLLAARDHFGGIPLYYCFGGDFAAVGPLRELANAGLVEKKLSLAGLCDYFSLRFIPAPDTIFEGIHALMAGHLLKVRFDGARVHAEERCWWDVDCRSENMLHDYVPAGRSCVRRCCTPWTPAAARGATASSSRAASIPPS